MKRKVLKTNSVPIPSIKTKTKSKTYKRLKSIIEVNEETSSECE